MTTWTLIDEQRPVTVEMGPDLSFDPAVLGWERKPEGLCRDEVCIPVAADKRLGLADIATLLGRPLALDTTERVAALAASAGDRSDALRSGMAPDFELPDVDGVLHRLSDHQGRKVVLYAYASW
jgi:hypothetical protein